MATITVGVNSYVTEAELQTYADDRGKTITATDLSVLLIQAMDYLNVQSWKGVKTDENQALDFPRGPDTEVPQAIKNAQMVLALEYDAGNDIQANIGRAVKRKKIDVIETEYMDNASATINYQKVTALLRPYLANSYSGGTTFEVKLGYGAI